MSFKKQHTIKAVVLMCELGMVPVYSHVLVNRDHIIQQFSPLGISKVLKFPDCTTRRWERMQSKACRREAVCASELCAHWHEERAVDFLELHAY